MTLKLLPTANSSLAVSLLPTVANLRASKNAFVRHGISRISTVGFYTIKLCEAPAHVVFATGKVPFAAVKLILDPLAPGAISPALGAREIGRHLAQAVYCVVIVVLDSLRAVYNPDNLVQLCVIRGMIAPKATLFNRIKDFALLHRKEIFFATGCVFVGATAYAIGLDRLLGSRHIPKPSGTRSLLPLPSGFPFASTINALSPTTVLLIPIGMILLATRTGRQLINKPVSAAIGGGISLLSKMPNVPAAAWSLRHKVKMPSINCCRRADATAVPPAVVPPVDPSAGGRFAALTDRVKNLPCLCRRGTPAAIPPPVGATPPSSIGTRLAALRARLPAPTLTTLTAPVGRMLGKVRNCCPKRSAPVIPPTGGPPPTNPNPNPGTSTGSGTGSGSGTGTSSGTGGGSSGSSSTSSSAPPATDLTHPHPPGPKQPGGPFGRGSAPPSRSTSPLKEPRSTGPSRSASPMPGLHGTIGHVASSSSSSMATDPSPTLNPPVHVPPPTVHVPPKVVVPPPEPPSTVPDAPDPNAPPPPTPKAEEPKKPAEEPRPPTQEELDELGTHVASGLTAAILARQKSLKKTETNRTKPESAQDALTRAMNERRKTLVVPTDEPSPASRNNAPGDSLNGREFKGGGASLNSRQAWGLEE